MSRLFPLVVSVLLFANSFAVADDSASVNDSELAEQLQPLIDAHPGEVAIAIRTLDDDVCYTHNAETPMPTASLIKFPIMLAAYHLSESGPGESDPLQLDHPVTLTEEDKVPGSGILTTHFSAGTTIPLRDAIRLMMAFSDNTATNLVIDQIGIPAVNNYMDKLGHSDTRLNAKVYRGSTTSVDPDRTERFGLGSTTANEMADLFTAFHAGDLAGDAANTEMREHLLHCEDRRKLARHIPASIPFLHKTGSLNATRNDAGILELPQATVVICVLTDENTDQSWGESNAAEILCGRIGEIVVKRFDKKENAETTSPAQSQ